MNYENEIWKPVPGYEGHYDVSDMGRVRSLKRGRITILTPSKRSKGRYYYVQLFINKISTRYIVHRLVYLAFKGSIPEDRDVDHEDGNTFNNTPSNLRLLSHRDNTQAGYDRKRKAGKTSSKYPGVSKHITDGIDYFRVQHRGKYVANFRCEHIAGFVSNLVQSGAIPPDSFRRNSKK